MGLNPRGRGRGGKGRRGGGMSGPGPMFRGPPGMYGPPPMGFPPGPPPFGPPFFGGPCGSNFGPRRPPGYGKFPRKNFKGRNQQKNNNTQVIDIDLTKPWITEEIKAEEAKKQECLETWRKSKDDGDWNKYKEQKQVVQNLYDRAKADYMANKPEEAVLWCTETLTTSLHCDACDKAFKDEKALYLHEMEHETCGRDGCEYSAHPKLVAKHIRMQHDTGLYNRIGKLNTKEEIAKWVEERKRKYPTKKVIEEKKLLEAEKLKRGERIKADDSKFNKSFSKRNDRSSKMKSFERKTLKDSKSHKQKKRRREEKDECMTVSEALKEESSWRGSVPPFSGIKAMWEVLGESISVEKEEEEKETQNFTDDEWEAPNQMLTQAKDIKKVSNALGILASSYDSDYDEEEPIIPSQTVTPVILDQPLSDNDAPEEVKTVHIKETEVIPEEEKISRKRIHRVRRGREKGRKRLKTNDENKNDTADLTISEIRPHYRREPTLLEKLLSKEIRHERNVILQCIRYVVENKFFLNT